MTPNKKKKNNKDQLKKMRNCIQVKKVKSQSLTRIKLKYQLKLIRHPN